MSTLISMPADLPDDFYQFFRAVVDRYPEEYFWFAPVFRVKVSHEN